MFENLEDILSDIRKKFGAESVHRLSSKGVINVETIRTGVPQLDGALGIGGWPCARIVELFGNESSGKTTLALHAIANVQKKGGTAAIVDAEHALDPDWAEKIGVNLDGVLLSQPDSGEEALELVEMYARSGIDIVLIDSVAALTPKAELEGEFGDSHMGLQARLMGQAMRKLRGVIRKSKTLCIFTNQVRMKIGVVFGNPETTPGGNALKFFASVRVQLTGVSPKEEDKDGKDVIYKPVNFKVVKNKLAPPFKVGTARIGFENGFDLGRNLFDGLIDYDVLDKKGNTFSLDGEKIGVGKKQVIEYISNLDDEETEKLYARMLLTMNEEYQELMQRKEQLEKYITKKKSKSKDCSGKEKELQEIAHRLVILSDSI